MNRVVALLAVALICTQPLLGQATAKEKMLIRYILQNEFLRESARYEVPKSLAMASYDERVALLADTTDAKLRMALVLWFGTYWGDDIYREKIKRTIKACMATEVDAWHKLEMARVLVVLGDDAGKDILVAALTGRDGFMTQSGMEFGKATLPLLLLDYSFPNGFPKQIPNYGWGGLNEYFQAIRKAETKP